MLIVYNYFNIGLYPCIDVEWSTCLFTEMHGYITAEVLYIKKCNIRDKQGLKGPYREYFSLGILLYYPLAMKI